MEKDIFFMILQGKISYYIQKIKSRFPVYTIDRPIKGQIKGSIIEK